MARRFQNKQYTKVDDKGLLAAGHSCERGYSGIHIKAAGAEKNGRASKNTHSVCIQVTRIDTQYSILSIKIREFRWSPTL